MKRVAGISGTFFKSESPPQPYDCHEKHLGIQRESLRARSQSLDSAVHLPQTTKYLGASKASFVVNCRLDNLDALREDLKKSGIEIDLHREDYDFGRVRLDHRPSRQPH